jgi:hypothetical protein
MISTLPLRFIKSLESVTHQIQKTAVLLLLSRCDSLTVKYSNSGNLPRSFLAFFLFVYFLKKNIFSFGTTSSFILNFCFLFEENFSKFSIRLVLYNFKTCCMLDHGILVSFHLFWFGVLDDDRHPSQFISL